MARRLHPEIAGRVSVADLTQPLPFPDSSFDFVMCNAVIQHIEAEPLFGVTLPEFARVLQAGGVLQLLFKCGSGTVTVHDKDYGVDRTFLLYAAQDVVAEVRGHGLEIVESDSPKTLGDLVFFTDVKNIEHCVFWARKRGVPTHRDSSRTPYASE